MKTPTELADYYGPSPKLLRKQATSLKCIATGLFREIRRSDVTGLSNTDIEKLNAAMRVINSLDSLFENASVFLTKREKALARIEQEVKESMQNKFDTLLTIKEKVLFIAAVNSHVLKEGRVKDLADLDSYFKESRVSLAFTMTRNALKENVHGGSIVDAYWRRWKSGITELETQYQTFVSALDAST